jgi:hypothetical protein
MASDLRKGKNDRNTINLYNSIDLLVRYVLPSPDRKHTKHHRYCQPQFLIRLEKIWLRTNMFFEHMVYEAETEISTIIL